MDVCVRESSLPSYLRVDLSNCVCARACVNQQKVECTMVSELSSFPGKSGTVSDSQVWVTFGGCFNQAFPITDALHSQKVCGHDYHTRTCLLNIPFQM